MELDKLSVVELKRWIKCDEFLMDFVAACDPGDIPMDRQAALFSRWKYMCDRLFDMGIVMREPGDES